MCDLCSLPSQILSNDTDLGSVTAPRRPERTMQALIQDILAAPETSELSIPLQASSGAQGDYHFKMTNNYDVSEADASHDGFKWIYGLQ